MDFFFSIKRKTSVHDGITCMNLAEIAIIRIYFSVIFEWKKDVKRIQSLAYWTTKFECQRLVIIQVFCEYLTILIWLSAIRLCSCSKWCESINENRKILNIIMKFQLKIVIKHLWCEAWIVFLAIDTRHWTRTEVGWYCC